MHVDVVTLLDHIPVGAVAIHRYLHSAAAGSYLAVEARRIEFGEFGFELVNVHERRSGGNVPSVEKNVHARALDALRFAGFEHAEKVRNVGMHVAVGQKSYEVHRRGILETILFEFRPSLGSVYRSGRNAFVDELCALRIYLSATEGVMSHFRITHIVVGRKSHRGAVRFEVGVRASREQLVERGSTRFGNGVAYPVCGSADAVHYYQNDLFFVHNFNNLRL